MKTKLMIAVCAISAAFVTSPASAAVESDPAAVAADAVLGRPLCFAATVLGSAIFVVTVPVAATSHSLHSTAEALVMKPARATFVRPVGDFSYHTQDVPYAKHNKHQRRTADTRKHPTP